MNIILFYENEIGEPLALLDARAKHILEVLRRKIGDTFDAGMINGLRGKGKVLSVSDEMIEWEFQPTEKPEPLFPIDLIVGLSRPQTNRKILQEATSMGVRSIRFINTERGEPSYLSSKLWTTGEWKRHVVTGAEQAFTTLLPEVRFGISLEEAIHSISHDTTRFALDNYEATTNLAQARIDEEIVLAIGSERGWTGTERDLLRSSGFELASLGGRPLRSETATIAGLALVMAKLARR